ncbi:site-specific DNA-methyltransferase [Pradoshia sp. D12]|uniref:site-specific DNA-methyltransferase n=1 Tax=Bacillaceae TaxID=186817 RepID=UPI00112BC120|nr:MULTISPECIES: site-specific DNA-methyltransferase [Bacillaceae]QFK71948.1 site-specific DNA-methyltransferase [Pradoshia sp. D12]TPF71560.1 site-specific DNA-methyltransferase [Bacillus sp. D12]
MVNKMNGESLDITAQNIARLKELFPEILTDGDKIDFDMLKTVLGEVVETEQERYQFTWHGKKKMIEGVQKPSKGTLRPVPEKSKNFDTTENLYIEGDNLEVLKLLQKSYNGKIKMIYIDPPYNTGKDFVYKDNFKDSVQNYLEQTGQVDSDGHRISTNSESNGRFHTDWLNMMYARLKLAKSLLTEDGAIFISIDDTELDNLRKICNEIYGESNFISQFNWKRKKEISSDSKNVSIQGEYILCYGKSSKVTFHLEELSKEYIDKSYKEPTPDFPLGKWRPVPLTVSKGLSGGGYEYPITTPSGIVHIRVWAYPEKSYLELIEKKRVYFGAANNGIPQRVIYAHESKGQPVSNYWDKISSNKEGKKEILNLFGYNAFDTPKPTDLIIKIMNLITEKHDYILDFFSGSATTAHAVMKKNVQDGGNRKFIMVQLPELLDEKSEAYKDGYRTICDIGEERIRRAGKRIIAEIKEKQQNAGMLNENAAVDLKALDIGFKVLKLDTSNIREWNVNFTNLEDELDLYETPFIDDRLELDIVYEIMLKQGLELTYPIDTFVVNGKKVYDIAFGSLFICLSKEMTPDIAKAMIARRDEHGTETSSVIFSDAGFSNDSDKLNCIEILKDAGYPEDNLLTI